MGAYELVDSDHISVVDVTCIESEFNHNVQNHYSLSLPSEHIDIRWFQEREVAVDPIDPGELYVRWKISTKLKEKAGCDTILSSATLTVCYT